MKRRVVVTGMGTLNPIGNSVGETWNAAKNGTCGIDEITLYDTEKQKVKIAGEVKNIDVAEVIGKKNARKMDRYCQLAVIAAKEAFEDSGLDMSAEDATRCGVIVSSGIGGLATMEEDHYRGIEKGFDRVSPYFIPKTISNMGAATIAIDYGFKGSCTSVVTACAAGSNAIGDSFRLIRDGYQDVMICGGAEGCVTPLAIGGFTSMKALSESNDKNRASIPFDKERSGFVLGEGAGILIVEEYEHAVARGAKIYGEIVGYGATCDAYHITSPSPDGEGGTRCMLNAVSDAGIGVESIDYINAHGTSTPINDRCETGAIKKAFGAHAYDLLVSSTKSMMGHLLGASGAVEAILTILMIKESFVLPTINYQVADEECDLDVVPNNGRKVELTYALSNSLGFGGHNASLVFKRFI